MRYRGEGVGKLREQPDYAAVALEVGITSIQTQTHCCVLPVQSERD